MMANDIPTAESFTPPEPEATGEASMLSARKKLGGVQLLVLLLWTFLADVLIFRAIGFSGPAVFLFAAPLLFLVLRWRGKRVTLAEAGPTNTRVLVVVVTLIVLVGLRMLWLGTGLNIFSGALLLIALAMMCSGALPFVLEGIAFASRAGLDGLLRIFGQHRSESIRPKHIHEVVDQPELPLDIAPTKSGVENVSWLMPIAAVIVFGGIFVFANPDLQSFVSEKLSLSWDAVWNWISGQSVWEISFCLCAFVLGAGLLMPVLPMPLFGPRESRVTTTGTAEAPMYAAFRNTLGTLIVLFGVYLVFEFSTLFRREFPNGFYYAGYAHQGAAWLTFALALATGLLSAVFSGQVLQDPRLGSLRKLSWIWSAMNFLLAVAVYNRLMIYVGYNGMTRMRTIGFFGITLVVVGFALVLYKIAKNRGFWWLIRAQLIAFVLTVIGYGLFPVDWVAHRYNASRVANGYLHPSVMIAVKPIDDGGVAPLLGLTEVDDPIIREGVLALLADRQYRIEHESDEATWHWTKYQGATSRLYQKLVANQSQWSMYLKDTRSRLAAIADFKNYAMQWY